MTDSVSVWCVCQAGLQAVCQEGRRRIARQHMQQHGQGCRLKQHSLACLPKIKQLRVRGGRLGSCSLQPCLSTGTFQADKGPTCLARQGMGRVEGRRHYWRLPITTLLTSCPVGLCQLERSCSQSFIWLG